MNNTEWIARNIADDRTYGTSGIDFDWGNYSIRCSGVTPDQGIQIKEALIALAKEYLKLHAEKTRALANQCL